MDSGASPVSNRIGSGASAVQKEHEQSLAFLLRVNVGNTARKIVDDALWLAVDT